MRIRSMEREGTTKCEWNAPRNEWNVFQVSKTKTKNMQITI